MCQEHQRGRKIVISLNSVLSASINVQTLRRCFRLFGIKQLETHGYLLKNY